ncbi:hypothetical protein [Methylobacter svalbardensis]|uniref:hypothetical protein n=1 Tax=Methylobacter svalbardensis TaxID=3080016 RepID=UPI0030EC3B69
MPGFICSSFPRSHAPALVVIHKSMGSRHSGRDCRNPDYMDVHSSPSMALDTRFPAGMTSYLGLVYNDERSCVGTRNQEAFYGLKIP